VYRDRIIILFLAIATILLWWPRVNQGLPYFYEEDEAHHFNRTVEMVKSGDLNPHYFHKPSLHFYLRIPAVALSFLNEVRQGRARKVNDIITRDPAGVGGYAFSTSHPGIVKGARLVSVICGIVLVLSVYAILFKLTSNRWWSVYGALLTLGARLLYNYGAEVGVDIVTAACVLACSAVAIWGNASAFPYFYGYIVSLLAGLAIGAKYNSAPVVLIPLYSLVRCQSSTWPSTLAKWLGLSFFVGLGFLCSTPYALSALPLFLNQIAYEVWHYGVVGHEGHMSDPGLPHLALYINDLANTYFGWGPVILGLVGLTILVCKWEFSVVLFPIAYLWYMSEQRAHFIRNMVVFAPYLGIGSAYFFSWINTHTRNSRIQIAVIALSIIVAAEPYYHLLMARQADLNLSESRVLAAQWLHSTEESQAVRYALDQSLQFEPNLRLDGVGRAVDLDQTTVESVFLDGFDGILLSQAHRGVGLVQQEWSGVQNLQRIVINPWIGAMALNKEWQLEHEIQLSAQEQVLPVIGAPEWLPGKVAEGWIWIQKRRAVLSNPNLGLNGVLVLEVMSPWPQQVVTINEQECRLENPGEWSSCQVKASRNEFKIKVAKVGVLPGASDARFLGVAIKGAYIQ